MAAANRKYLKICENKSYFLQLQITFKRLLSHFRLWPTQISQRRLSDIRNLNPRKLEVEITRVTATSGFVADILSAGPCRQCHI